MIKIITIPFSESLENFTDKELQEFSKRKKILNYKAEFFKGNNNSYWTILLEYENSVPEKLEKKDEYENLNENEIDLYNKLKVWRKEKAQKEAISVYIVSTNKILNDIVKLKPKTKVELENINGFGKRKIEKYSDEILEIVKKYYNAKGE